MNNEGSKAMTPDEYQVQAMRTLCDQEAAQKRIASRELAQFLHAVIGLQGEVGELASLLQKWVWYGKTYTLEELRREVKMEAGDVCWYLAELLSFFDLTLQEVLDANIAKLRVRYPERWGAVRADHANRDLEAERDAVVARNLTTLAAGGPTPCAHADHDWGLIQTPAGDGRKCRLCGMIDA